MKSQLEILFTKQPSSSGKNTDTSTQLSGSYKFHDILTTELQIKQDTLEVTYSSGCKII
jgi:hypothetical protein